MRHSLTIFTLAAIILLSPFQSSFAANRTWDGGGTDDNWTTVANWDGDVTAPSAGDGLQFAASVRNTPNNDFASGTYFNGILFQNMSPSYVLSGNAIQLSVGIANIDDSLQTVNLPLQLTAGVLFNAIGANITIGGIISDGAGTFGITKTGGGTLNLNAPNTYKGVTSLQLGTIQLGNDDALGSGGLQFAGGILNANNRSITIGALSLTANSTLNLVSDSNGSSLTFASFTAETGDTLTIFGWSGSDATDDRIFITADPGATFLSQINFDGFASGAAWVGGEIVPVPEPTEWALIIFATLATLYKFVLPRFRRPVF